jgi:hypothetical protein
VFKRLFWLMIGFTWGLGTSWFVVRSVKRTVRRTVEAYTPAQLASRAGDGYREVRVNLKAAVIEGREAMRDREAELWARVEAGRTGRNGRNDLAPNDLAPNDGATDDGTIDDGTIDDGGIDDPVDPIGHDGANAAGAARVADELAARRRRPAATPAGTARTWR